MTTKLHSGWRKPRDCTTEVQLLNYRINRQKARRNKLLKNLLNQKIPIEERMLMRLSIKEATEIITLLKEKREEAKLVKIEDHPELLGEQVIEDSD